MTTTPVKHPTRTKTYKALLVALDGDKEAALAAYNAHAAQPVDEPTETPVEAKVDEPKAKKKHKKAKKAKLSAQDTINALVATRGFGFTRGRVYVTPTIVEACVRVLKTGHTEIVESSGKGRIDAVLIARTEQNDVFCQNLVRA